MDKDLFGFDDIKQRDLDKTPPVEILEEWPHTLRDLMDIYSAKYIRRGFSTAEAEDMAFEFIYELAQYANGRQLYIPRNDSLKRAYRDRKIFHDFGKTTPNQLAKIHNLTLARIYEIYKIQKSLHIKRIQPDLFADD